DDEHPQGTLVDKLGSDRAVRSIASIQRVPLDVSGAGLPAYSAEPLRGNVTFVVLSGRAPRGPDEIALGPASARALHRGIGGTVKATGRAGTTQTFKVVGTTLLLQTPHSSFDQGVWITPPALQKLRDPSAQDVSAFLGVTSRDHVKSEAFVKYIGKK